MCVEAIWRAHRTKPNCIVSRSKGSDNWKISKAYVRALARFYINRSTRYAVESMWCASEWVSECVLCSMCEWASSRAICVEIRRVASKNANKKQHQLKVNSIQVRRRSEMFALLKCYFKHRYWCDIVECSMNLMNIRKHVSLLHIIFCRYKYNNQFLYSNSH